MNKYQIGRNFELECIPFLESLFDIVEHKNKKGHDFIVWKNGKKYTVEAKIVKDGKTGINPILTEPESNVDYLITKQKNEIKIYDKKYIKKNITIAKIRKGFQNVAIRKEDIKRLISYKIHPAQPYWEVIRDFLDGKIPIEEVQLKQTGFSLHTQKEKKEVQKDNGS